MRGTGIDGKQVGNVDEAFKTAARVIEHEYEWPFQSHASMGPGCGVVDARPDRATVWTGSPKPHYCRDGVAAILGMKPNQVEGISHQAAGAYGRNDAGDACIDAAVLSKAVGRPVRLQYSREEGTGWDPKGPASIHRVKAGLDTYGNVIAYEFYTKAFSRWDVQTNESRPERTLAGHFLGAPLKSEDGFGGPAESYTFPNKKAWWETIHPLLERASPLRTSHLRDPVGPQIQFASESFWDEVAHSLGVDPVELRLKYVKDPRDAAVLKAAAEKHGWKPRPPHDKTQNGNTVTGRGIAYARRNGTVVAIVAEVDVDRRTGKIWARKFTVAHDCSQIINPDGPQAHDRRQHHPGHQPHDLGRGAVQQQGGDQHRLAELSDPRHHRDAGRDRLRADQPAGARSDRRRRAVDPPGGGRHRQCGVRRHRRAHPPRAVHPGPGPGGDVVSRHNRPSERPAQKAGLFS